MRIANFSAKTYHVQGNGMLVYVKVKVTGDCNCDGCYV